MHSVLPTHVLALAPDSLASMGDLDSDSLSEIWAIFTRCKDSLQNGRRLENLSWRLWYDSGRRDKSLESGSDELSDQRVDEIRQQVVDDGWSDPEWEEATDSEGSEDEATDSEERSGRPTDPPRSPLVAAVPPTAQVRARTSSVPTESTGAGLEAAQRPPFRRGVSREWKSTSVISGGSLQRMIADLQRLPDIPIPGKARSLHDVSVPTKPPLGSRGSSAPDNLNAAALSRPSTPPLSSSKVDAPTQTTPGRSRRASPVRSPCMSRSASTPSHPTVSTSNVTVTAPTPPPGSAASRRVPSALTMSAMPPSRRSRPPSPSPPSPDTLALTPTETAMLALSNSRNQSDANLHRRSQSTAELAASFKPASFVRGFNPSPSSLEAHPRPGSIAPPPTPAAPQAASLALSPPTAKTPASSPASVLPSALRAVTPAKVPPPRTSAPAAGPSAIKPAHKAPGRDKKIFFISSPESDEDHSSRSRDSKVKVVLSPPTQAAADEPGPLSAMAKGKAQAQPDEDEDDDDWDSEDDEDDDASSGWGSEYSTDSEIVRNASGNTTGAPRGTGRPGLDFTRRAPSELTRTASTVSIGQPGELKPRPPGLLSQLFHPAQFIDEPERPHSAADLRRNHKSMSALPTLGQLRPSQSSGVLNDPRLHRRSKSFLKGKPEDVELESSSDEDDGDDAPAAPRSRADSVASRDERSSDYEDVDEDDDAGSSAESAAALLARRQRQALAAELEAQAAVHAPPQTPRTTRRAMLATELSESLRRNLLWERQTRNRVLGGALPRRPMMPGEPLPQRPASAAQLNPPPSQLQAQGPPAPVAHSDVGMAGPVAALRADEGLRAPHPSPAQRGASPAVQRARADPDQAAAPPPPQKGHLVRRHTTGTGLYLAAQTGQLARALRAESDSELSQSEDEGDESDDDGRAAVDADAADLFAGAGAGQRVW
ncbi:hypothetical protein JCM10207_007914 [Rhodosporidiobolus poonsookiae]